MVRVTLARVLFRNIADQSHAGDLKDRLFELPPRHEEAKPFFLLLPAPAPYQGPTTDVSRLPSGVPEIAAALPAWLQQSGWLVEGVLYDSPDLWAAARDCDLLETGAPQHRTLLFEPCPLLTACIEDMEAQHGADAPLTCLDVGALPQA